MRTTIDYALERLTPSPKIDPVNITIDSYVIDKELIMQVTTQEYREFLKEAGYADLDNCSSIHIAKNMLKWNQSIRDAALRADLSLTGNDDEYVVNINQTDSRKLVETMNSKLLTTCLMYKLFIPHITNLVSQGNEDAQVTLDEMFYTKAEWLEDLILDQSKVKIGAKEISLALPTKDGWFNLKDMNEFGYPTKINKKGEFHYFYYEVNDENAAIRSWGIRLAVFQFIDVNLFFLKNS